MLPKKLVQSQAFDLPLAENLLRIAKSRFFGFSLVGGLVMILGLALLSFEIEVLGMNEVIAGIGSMVFSVELNFLLNKYINWRDVEGDFGRQWLRFHSVRLGAIVFNQLAYSLLVTVGVHYLITMVTLTVVVTIYNYIGNQKFVFKEN